MIKEFVKKNCPLYKHRILGHGIGESKCILVGSDVPLRKECPVDDKTYERRVDEEMRRRENDYW